MKIIKLQYKEYFSNPWKIFEWGSWFLLNIIAFVGSSTLWTLTGNPFAWLLGFSILLLALFYGESMRRKGAQEELIEVEEREDIE